MTSVHEDQFIVVPPVHWGESDPFKRGAIFCTDRKGSLHNAIGNYGAAYTTWRAAAVAAGRIDPQHRPDYTKAVSPLRFRQNSHWSGPNAIASFDPFGHLVPELYPDLIASGYNVRPTIAFTKATLDQVETRLAMANGLLRPDGRVLNDNGTINVTKIAIEPVWYIPSIARYYGTEESAFREGLYHGLGKSNPDLLKTDLRVFLPSIEETTVYIIGDFSKVGDPAVTHAARTHDKCASSDVHGATICSCRPALMWGYEEAIRVAQDGGIGIIVATGLEGRGHGVISKNLVYNARQTGPDRPEDYFGATVRVTGAEDLREQMLPTDIYRWMGVNRINVWLSGSPHKTAAMRNAGIEIVEGRPLPLDRLPDYVAEVEIRAKIGAGYAYV